MFQPASARPATEEPLPQTSAFSLFRALRLRYFASLAAFALMSAVGTGVIGFVGDDAADAAAGIGVIARAAGDQMKMAMEDRLPGRGAIVDAKIEAGDGGVVLLQFRGKSLREAQGGGPFVWREIAERRHVALRDDQRMADADGESIAKGHTGAIGGNDPVGRQRAEWAGRTHGAEHKTRARAAQMKSTGAPFCGWPARGGRRLGRCAVLTAGGPCRYTQRNSFGGEIAQLVEQRTENPCVTGSIPVLATIFLCVGKGCGAP